MSAILNHFNKLFHIPTLIAYSQLVTVSLKFFIEYYNENLINNDEV